MAGTVQQVRKLIPDTEAVYDGETLFTDGDIEDYLTLGAGSALRAAGFAIIAISNSEAMISKVIKTQDLSTNGAAVAEQLRKSAEVLFDRADREESIANEFYIDTVDYAEGWQYARPELTEWNWNP
jgi:hypothetical protein